MLLDFLDGDPKPKKLRRFKLRSYFEIQCKYYFELYEIRLKQN